MPEIEAIVENALETIRETAEKMPHGPLAVAYATLVVTVQLDSPKTWDLYQRMMQDAVNKARESDGRN